MKKTILSLLLFLPILGNAQFYSPFNYNQQKRFVNLNDSLDSEYYFYPTDTIISLDTIYFEQYLSKSDTFIDVSNGPCTGWGGGFQPTADTTWLGRIVGLNTFTNHLILNNYNQEELLFDFGILLGDSAVFYSNGVEDYFIRWDSLYLESFLDTIDNVRSFSIWKYDQTGNLLSSSLNGFQIKLSENFGLISFIDCHHFPIEETGLEIMGILNPNLGYYSLTYDEVYPWNPGDTLEYEGKGSYGNGYFSYYYKLLTIQNRIETNDSVWIYIDQTSQIIPETLGWGYAPPHMIIYSNPIVFQKGDVISKAPNKAFVGGFVEYSEIDTCNSQKSLRFNGDFLIYDWCCDCFNPADASG
ncbi:MAG: hypothetical protein KDC84_15705, partial [Crocinitomicaceae bacterium]|nr:hypothetical protein [Crocinitomicaceae bacterium]